MRPFNPEGLIRENILRLKPYSSARSEQAVASAVMLDANENPFGEQYNRYPDPLQHSLKARLAALKGVAAERIFIGNGSDEVIDILIRVSCRPGTDDHILICPPTYGMYEVSAATNDVAVLEVPLTRQFGLDLPAVLGAVSPSTKLVFLCSPNNPSGNLLRASDIRTILDRAPGLVVIDEAYIDFGDSPSWTGELDVYGNLVVMQTCSKAWGLAGLRIGMAFADPALVAVLNKVKAPYNIPASSQLCALEALADTESCRERVAELLRQRGVLQDALQAIPYVRTVYPSDANFLLVEVTDADSLYQRLLACGIVVRNRSTAPGCQNCIRITVGTQAENEQLIAAMRRFQS